MKSRLSRRQFVSGGAAAMAAGLSLPSFRTAAEESPGVWSLENQYVKYVVGANACSLHFIDKADGKDYGAGNGKTPLACVKKSGKSYEASSARFEGDHLALTFGDSGVQAVMKAIAHPQHLVFEVLSVTGDGIEELTFLDIPVTLQGVPSGTLHHWEVKAGDPQKPEPPPQDTFTATALALNLQTNITSLPQPLHRLTALCYPRFGMVGAKVAVVAAPPQKLRVALQEAVAAAEAIPHSPLGGPWAMDEAINRGSYILDVEGITTENVDRWIQQAQSLGMNQFDLLASVRHGDCRPNPKLYPEGVKSLKAVIDKLHAAGISAGLHTYAFFIDKRCPWVTPVPDPRLAKDATLTLAADLAADATTVPVVESTAKMSATTGFFVQNSNTIQIDDELITYAAVTQEAPFAFTGCKRGACGTQAAAHTQNAKAHHLKECFSRFVPDPATTLFEEVAAATADTFNTCGFDMIYLDALDGEGVLGGAENGWHYGSRFTYELWKRLKKPALVEMSTFHHHLWCVRSRLGAWDYARRNYKRFVDIHCATNENNRRFFMPSQLGWWAIKNWSNQQAEPTLSDDIEYLMAKCLGNDTGLSLVLQPDGEAMGPSLERLGAIIRRYEALRHSGKVPEAVKAKLRVPGDEYTLLGDLENGWQFRPAQYIKHKVECDEPWSNRWKVVNKFGSQPLQLRIEALLAAGPFDAADNPVLADFAAPGDFPNREFAASITADWKPVPDLPPSERPSAIAAGACLTATNSGTNLAGSWAKLAKTFAPVQNLQKHQGLGLWIYGDGQGELLNVQLKSPAHLPCGIADHYIIVDFTGWRYFELIESEGERYTDCQWPYGDIYSMYRDPIEMTQVETLGLWFNDLPPGKTATCYVSPIKALPLIQLKLTNPTVTIGKQSFTLPVEIPTGHYVELLGGDCTLYGPDGKLLRKIDLPQPIPTIQPGENEVQFHAQTEPGIRPRARVTVIAQGEAIA